MPCLYPCHLPAVLLSESTILVLLLLKERERREGDRARKRRRRRRETQEFLRHFLTPSFLLPPSLTHSIWPVSSTVIFLFLLTLSFKSYLSSQHLFSQQFSLAPLFFSTLTPIMLHRGVFNFLSTPSFRVMGKKVKTRDRYFYLTREQKKKVRREETRLTCVVFSAIYLVIDVHR